MSTLEELHESIPFASVLGIALVEASPELVRARLDWTLSALPPAGSCTAAF
jgi:hypothetical protein